MGKYGYFSEDKFEYIITRPDTPAPWVNYLTNRTYHALISNTGGGYSFYISPKDSRITRWRYNCLPVDRPGRYVYLRDQKTQEYWSITWQPVAKQPKEYLCRHGLGYTIISTVYNDIKGQIIYFVPLEDELEIWWITVENLTETERVLDIFSFVELCLGHALVDLINQPNDQHFNEVYFSKENGCIYATKRYWVTFTGPTVKQTNQEWNKYVFFSSSLPVIGYDGSKSIFIGPWRSESNPIAVERGSCFNTEITSGDAVAVLQNQIVLQPSEKTEFVILLGVVDKVGYLEKSKPILLKYKNLQNVNSEFEKVKKYWREYVSSAQADTPDQEMNLMLNIWNQYQTKMTFIFSRNAGYYHGGLLFGRGYRDASQDLLGPLIPEPHLVRERIIELARHQFKNGSVMHCYYPLTGGGEVTGHADTPLWFPLAVVNYLKETADFKLLDETVPFQDSGSATILEHFLRNIDYVLKNKGPRGLPKFGPGDWNDTLDYLGQQGIGESVWVGMFLAYILKEAIELLSFIKKKPKTIEKYKSAYQRLKDIINNECWDGQWYIRGTNDWGEVIGSASCEEGKIFLNTQSWAVISGIADKDRGIQCMDSVKKLLDTPKGPKILHPPFTKINPRIGLATRCVPGKKENGAVFNHALTWSILAECLLGRGDIAYEYYKKALPFTYVKDEDLYEMEPYVYAEYVTSPDHPTFGQASHSWLTGTAAWMLRVGFDYILGVRPTYSGLLIDPCIPKHWKEYKVTRKFRGAIYEITVRNQNGVNTGVKEVTINGEPISSNLLPVYPSGATLSVTAIL